MGKERAVRKEGKSPRHNPLHVELEQQSHVADPLKGRGSERRKKAMAKEQKEKAKESTKKAEFVSEKLSKKILEQAKRQQEEIEREEAKEKGATSAFDLSSRTRLGKPQKRREEEEEEEEEGMRSEDEDDELEEGFDMRMEAQLAELEGEEEEALSYFMGNEAPQRKTLADMIMEKVKEKETEIMTLASERGELDPQKQMNPKVVAVYQGVGKLLSRYRAGALPKAFKIIPSLSNWEEVLYLTNPDSWSYQAMYQATRIFASNLNAKMAQRFFNLVLLPRIRDDFQQTKKINYHLYMALKKALYKPGSFFKGILLPLCEAGDCSLREAAIIGSVLTKVSVPVLHSSAALLKIAEMNYSGVNSLFMRLLLDKKYALPFRVLDSVVFHFMRFANSKVALPVLWHQSLLVFVQRYKEDITSEQKEALLDLVKSQGHHLITAEIRREIINSTSRGEEKMEEEIDLNFGYNSD